MQYAENPFDGIDFSEAENISEASEISEGIYSRTLINIFQHGWP